MAANPAVLHQKWGIYAYGRRNWPDAADNLSRAVELDPSLTEAWYFLGLTHHSLNQLDEAVEDFDTALCCGNNLACIRRRGYARMEAGDYARAIADFRIVLDADPADIETLHMSALACMELEDYAGAVENLTHAIDLAGPGDNNALLYASRARAYTHLGDQISAMRDKLLAEQH